MKRSYLVFTCLVVFSVWTCCSEQWRGQPIVHIIDVDGMPWKFVVSNDVAEIEDASGPYVIHFPGGYITDSFPAIPKSFSGAISVPSVLDGYKVEKIGYKAFRGCTNLTAVSIPPGITEIGVQAFEHCRSLKEISIPDGVRSIGSRAFRYCGALKEISFPDSVETIGWASFLRCTSLERVRLSDHIADIPKYAFHECNSLKTFTFPNSLRSIGAYAFGMSGLTEILIPHTVTNIEEHAFWGCNSLRNIDLPSGLIAMGRRSFIGDDHLQEVKLPDNLERIQSETFKYCLRLRSVSFPKNLKSIEDAAFNGCPALEAVDFPNSLTNIGAYAFSRCSSLKEVTFPHYLKSLGASAFFHCTALKRVRFVGDAPHISAELPFETNVVIEVAEGTKGWDDNRWKRYKIKVVPSESRSFSTDWVIDDDVKVDFDEAKDGTNYIMRSTTNSILGQHKVPRMVMLWFEEPNYDSCPRMLRALGCQEHLLSGYENSDYMLPVDLVFYIRNDTGFPMRIGEEQFTCGYYCLEIDIRLTNGNCPVLR